MSDRLPDLLLISVGNTRTRYAPAVAGQLEPATSLPNADLDRLVRALEVLVGENPGMRPLVASVNDPVADQIEARLTTLVRESASASALGGRDPILRFGRDLPIPMDHALPPPITTGQDRLLAALGAFDRSKQACVVIDAGTAITVDFVDGEGTFQGGAIAPGVRMMMAAMHTGTAALPATDFSPDLLPKVEGDADGGVGPFGKTTATAMAVGAVSSARGLAHHLIDRYAEFYGAYPRVVATGGDAALLFDGDPLIELIVPDLTLVGMLAACRIVLASAAAESEDGGAAGGRGGDEADF